MNAVERLYEIKGRSNTKPVSLMVSSVAQIKDIMQYIPESIESVLQKLFPGKITALLDNNLKDKIAVFKYLKKEPEKVGFRIPQSRFCNLLCNKMENPVSTTSANISGRPDITNISTLPDSIKDQLDLIIDAGDAEDVKGSTIIDFTEKPYRIVRDGSQNIDDLKKILTDGNFNL